MTRGGTGVLALLGAALCVPGCSWHSPERAHRTLDRVQQLMARQAYDQALEILRASKAEKPPQGQPRLAIWKPWDRVVYWSEEGTLALLAGEPDASIRSLRRADRRITEIYTRSIRRTHNSVRGGAYEDDYRPPAHERLLLHVMLVLDHIAMGDVEGAMVAARRGRKVARLLGRGGDERRLETAKNATYIQWVASTRGSVPAIAQARERARRLWDRSGWSPTPPPWVLGPWLDAVLHEHAGDPSADVARRKALAAARALPADRRGRVLAWLGEDAERSAASPAGQVIVIHLRGRGPQLRATHGHCVCGEYPAHGGLFHVQGLGESWTCAQSGKVLPRRLPTIYPSVVRLETARPGPGRQVRVGSGQVRLQTLVDVNALARRYFERRRSLIYWRALMRERLGPGKIGQETRSWRTLPACIDVGRLFLPPGPATLEILDDDGRPVGQRQVEIARGRPALVVLQSF